MISLPGLSSHAKNASFYSKNHQLNNQGCLCPLCQKVNVTQNLIQHFFLITDRQSQLYDPVHHKQTYLDLIDELMEWQKYPRKLRYSLPQMCIFFGGNPVHLITKAKDTLPIKLIRSKSKLNIFQLQNFFLDGYLAHHPNISNKKRQKHQWKQKIKQICIIAAKYSKNVTALYTLNQLSNMFKSKFRYMRDDLMYMQTLVGADHAADYSIKVDLDVIEGEYREVFQRAKLEAAVFVGEVKITDPEYYGEREEVDYENQLRRNDRKLFLIYMALKIILISSKGKPKIIKQSIFKWTCVKSNDFLWDVRVLKYDNSAPYWQSSSMQALQIKLKKTMSMIQFGSDKAVKIDPEKLSPKAKEFSGWLEKSTQFQWNQMKVIRNRLEKLEDQKKKLLESQKEGHNNRMFRMRSMKKRQSSVFNPEQ